ncbi:uncharacterized protein LOC143434952 isoform X2 [Arvicanthis niloticus]|uniref:uncharacterized protein LOC143309281 isoform X2 n=1 Tax=Arvicanthis niloticus TaxID=61156 RepID=UPI00402B831A
MAAAAGSGTRGSPRCGQAPAAASRKAPTGSGVAAAAAAPGRAGPLLAARAAPPRVAPAAAPAGAEEPWRSRGGPPPLAGRGRDGRGGAAFVPRPQPARCSPEDTGPGLGPRVPAPCSILADPGPTDATGSPEPGSRPTWIPEQKVQWIRQTKAKSRANESHSLGQIIMKEPYCKLTMEDTRSEEEQLYVRTSCHNLSLQDSSKQHIQKPYKTALCSEDQPKKQL